MEVYPAGIMPHEILLYFYQDGYPEPPDCHMIVLWTKDYVARRERDAIREGRQ
jgi:hypothetical protein